MTNARLQLSGAALLCVALLTGCASAAPSEVADEPTAEPAAEVPQAEPPQAEAEVQPQPFIPGGAVGSAQAYDELISELEQEIPIALRDQVPWPDLRNPDPVQAQLAIFDLWIWMSATNPEPALVPVMAAPDSPSRFEIAGIFGGLKASDELHSREQQPYRAYEHRVVTFETAGLPLWLGRDVPEDAVVIYYQDDSGPTTIRDRKSGIVLGTEAGVGNRQWLSIMVPTDVGWLLYRDQLIEPGNQELPVPDPNADDRKPQV